MCKGGSKRDQLVWTPLKKNSGPSRSRVYFYNCIRRNAQEGEQLLTYLNGWLSGRFIVAVQKRPIKSTAQARAI